MAQLTILHYPDPRLRIEAEPVAEVDERIRTLVSDMLETMYEAHGIGLAATQVNVHERVLVVDISEKRDQPLCLINPRILHSEGEVSYEEGCLSVPDFSKPSAARSSFASRRSMRMANALKWKRRGCSPSAYSMRWTTWTGSCSWTISRRSNGAD